MAGMISLMNNSHMRLESSVGLSTADDGYNDYRSAPANKSPMLGRRNLGIGQLHMKTIAGSSDRLPKRFRKRRCHEIHPMLRRSVCTLLLAGIGIIAGICVVLVEHIQYNKISNSGIIILCTAMGFVFVGIIWLWWSYLQLRKVRSRISKPKETTDKTKKVFKDDNNRLNHQHTNTGKFPIAKAASKWPTQRALKGESAKFSCELTGNELYEDNHNHRSSSETTSYFVCPTHDSNVFYQHDKCLWTSSEDSECTCLNGTFNIEDKTSCSESPTSNQEKSLDYKLIPTIFVSNHNEEADKVKSSNDIHHVNFPMKSEDESSL